MDASALSELDYFRIRDEAAAYCVAKKGKRVFANGFRSRMKRKSKR